MGRWVDEEKEDILDTRSPTFPQYSEAEEDDEIMEVALLTKGPQQAPLADAEEEIASNPPPAKDKPTPITLDEATPITLNETAPIVLDEATPINLKEEEPVANTCDDAPSA